MIGASAFSFVLFPISGYIQPIRAIFDRDIMRAYGIYINEMTYVIY